MADCWAGGLASNGILASRRIRFLVKRQLADLIAAERVVGRILAEPRAGSSGFHVADELVFQSVPGSVRGSPNRGITLASKPVTAPMRSSAIVTTCSP